MSRESQIGELKENLLELNRGWVIEMERQRKLIKELFVLAFQMDNNLGGGRYRELVRIQKELGL